MQLQDVRDATQSLIFDLERRRGDALAGDTTTLGLAAAFRDWPMAASLEAAAYVRELASKAEGRRVARLQALAARLYRLCLERDCAGALEAREQADSSSDLAGLVPGERLTVRGARAAIATAGHRDSRADLAQRTGHVLEAHVTCAARTIELAQRVATRAGFSSAPEAVAALEAVDLAAWQADAEHFLDATEAMYVDVLSWRLRKSSNLRLFPDGAEHHDVAWSLGLHELAGLFPSRDLEKTLVAPLAAVGLASRRVTVDLVERALRHPDVVVAATSRERIRVALRQQGGHGDTHRLLDGLGQATALAHVGDDRPFEDFGCGDASVTLAYGRLFGGWLLDAGWLKRSLEAQAPDLVRLNALVELHRVRHAVTRALAVLHLHRESAGRQQVALVTDRASVQLHARWVAPFLLADVDGDLAAVVARVRAEALAGALHAHFEARHDADWWRNPKGVQALRALMAQGRLEPANLISERLGAGPLSLGIVARRLEVLLGA